MKSITRRQLLGGFGALGATALLAACTPGGGTSAPTQSASAFSPKKVTGTVNVWNFPTQLTQPAQTDFAAYVPNAKVKLSQYAQADLHQQLLVSLSTGTDLPDAAIISSRLAPQFVDTGSFADLSDVLAPYLPHFDKASIIKSSSGAVNGVVIGGGNMGFWVNKAALASRGVDTDKFTTWDAVLDAARKISKDSGGTEYLFIQPDGVNGANQFNSFFHSMGGNWWTKGNKVETNLAIAEKALKFYNTLRQEKLIYHGVWVDPSFWTAVQQEKLLGFVMNYSVGAQLLPRNVPSLSGKWQMLTWPKWSEGAAKQTGAFGGAFWGALKGGTNPDGGLANAAFWMSEKGLPLTVSLMGPIGYAPAKKLPEFQIKNDYFAGQTVLADLSSVPYPEFNYYKWADTQQVIGTSLDKLLLGQLEPNKAAAAIEAGLKQVLWN